MQGLIYILRAYWKIVEKTISFFHACLSVRTSAHLKQRRSHWTDIYEISYLSFSKNMSKIQFRLKSSKNIGYMT